jgi:hypothetical protein
LSRPEPVAVDPEAVLRVTSRVRVLPRDGRWMFVMVELERAVALSGVYWRR